MTNSGTKKVMVLGLDGATLKLARPWCLQGELPHLARIMAEGVWGELESTIHPQSAPAWTSFMTGKNPGKHGVLDHTYRRPGSYDLAFVNSHTRRGKTLWRLLSEAGGRVGIINMPCTYPPEEVNGFLIPGLGAPGVTSDFAFPPSIVGELKQTVGEYVIEPYIRDYLRRGEFQRFFPRLMEVLEKRFQAARYFLTTKAWDLFMVVFTETDRVQHFFWKYMDPSHPLFDEREADQYGTAILTIYKRLDQILGWFLNELGDDTTVLVVSDHGQGGNNNKALYINKWLAHQGFLTFLEQDCLEGLLRKAILFGKRHVSRTLKDRLRAGLLAGMRAKGESLVRRSSINWERTRAYSDEIRGNIWINVKGREPRGIVEMGHEYEQICHELIAQLRQLTDPETGEPIADRVYRREEVYAGKYSHLAPDILFLQREDAYHYVYRRSNSSQDPTFIKMFSREELSGDLKPNASHRLMGLFLARGEAFKEGEMVTGYRIIDLAPTILYLMGLPVPEDMDGEVLTGAIKEAYLGEHPVRSGPASGEEELDDAVYAPDEATKIQEHLKDLGYL